MITDLLNKINLKGNWFAGVDLFIHDNGDYDISLVILGRKKNLVEIKEKYSDISSIDELKNIMNRNFPVCLSIDGKGLIHKEIEVSDTEEPVFPKIFPNASPDDFFIQKHIVNENSMLVSIGRKDQITGILNKFRTLGLFVTDLRFGPLFLDSLAGMLPDINEIVSKNHRVSFEGNIISKFERNFQNQQEFNYTIMGEHISSKLILAFATALYPIINANQTPLFENNAPELNGKEFQYKRILSLSAWIFLFFTFALLLINYLFFEHYRNRQQNLEIQLGFNTFLIDKLELLQTDYKLKKDLVDKSGLTYLSRISYYADRIAANTPPEIILDKLLIFPIKSKVKYSEEILFERDQISISGTSNSSVPVNEWIRVLKREPWIKNISLTGYNQQSLAEPGTFELFIEIGN